MAKKFVADPEKRRLRQEELSRIEGVPIEPATASEAAAINTRISQIGRGPTSEVVTPVASAEPEIEDVRSSEGADVPRAPDVIIKLEEKTTALPDRPSVEPAVSVESVEPAVSVESVESAVSVEPVVPVEPVESVEPIEPAVQQEPLPNVEPPLPAQSESDPATTPVAEDSAGVEATIPPANPENKRGRGRPRVIPLDAKGVLIRTPPDIKQRLKEIKGGEGPAGLSLIRLALDLIDAAGGVDVAQDAVVLTRSVISADNKNIAAQAARDLFNKRFP